MHLALLDIDEENLSKAKQVLSQDSLKTEAYPINVGDADAWKKVAQNISAAFPEIDLVVLNAGKGYKPESQESGRLNPWLDGSYWRKVGQAGFPCSFLYLQVLKLADIRHQCVWTS